MAVDGGDPFMRKKNSKKAEPTLGPQVNEARNGAQNIPVAQSSPENLGPVPQRNHQGNAEEKQIIMNNTNRKNLKKNFIDKKRYELTSIEKAAYDLLHNLALYSRKLVEDYVKVKDDPKKLRSFMDLVIDLIIDGRIYAHLSPEGRKEWEPGPDEATDEEYYADRDDCCTCELVYRSLLPLFKDGLKVLEREGL